MPFQRCLRETDDGGKFHDNTVRERLMRLMGTETVRILDRTFMSTFADRLSDQNWEMIKERIEEREKLELNREKQMVLSGMIPLSESPEGFAEHPYFAIMRHVAEDVARKKAKIEAHQVRKRMNKMFDYSNLPIVFKEEMDESTLSALALIQESSKTDSFDLGFDDVCLTSSNERQGSEESSAGSEIDKEGQMASRYEAPCVRSLRKAKTVDEMYRMADSIFHCI